MLIPDIIRIGRLGAALIVLWLTLLTASLGFCICYILERDEVLPVVAPVQIERTYITIQYAYDSKFYDTEGYDIMSYGEPITK